MKRNQKSSEYGSDSRIQSIKGHTGQETKNGSAARTPCRNFLLSSTVTLTLLHWSPGSPQNIFRYLILHPPERQKSRPVRLIAHRGANQLFAVFEKHPDFAADNRFTCFEVFFVLIIGIAAKILYKKTAFKSLIRTSRGLSPGLNPTGVT